MRGEPNFALVDKLASEQGMRLLQDAEEALSNAEPLIASVACKLEPLVGPTAAQGLALAKDCKSHLLHLQNKLRGLRQSVDRLKRDEKPRLSEDAVLERLADDWKP
ncbi:MAG TPA: hypothetical protein PKI03_07820 [Pseudomonadota bacterium]|jgi:exonuclease VII small subunit|nr:hypothetical protein [Pseudomonadota bacterium]